MKNKISSIVFNAKKSLSLTALCVGICFTSLSLVSCSNDNQAPNVSTYYMKAINSFNEKEALKYLDTQNVSKSNLNARERLKADLAQAKDVQKQCGAFQDVSIINLEQATSENYHKSFVSFTVHYQKCNKTMRQSLIRTRDGWRIY